MFEVTASYAADHTRPSIFRKGKTMLFRKGERVGMYEYADDRSGLVAAAHRLRALLPGRPLRIHVENIGTPA